KLDETYRKLWDKKAAYLAKENESSQDIFDRAGIYAEFGKIICISSGIIFSNIEGTRCFKIKSFYNTDEKKLLQDFFEMLNKFDNNESKLLCAHNGKEFDFPYIARRALINGLRLPLLLDISGKKPWEIKHLDTMELWKFGDYKNYTSLELLAKIFNIPTPKDDISGADVAKVYYSEKNIDRIVKYCEKDVLAIAQLFLKYKCEDLITEDHVERIS
ncbi:MAG: 3'-5' exonuclease, partial [Bacteroidota bacterium]